MTPEFRGISRMTNVVSPLEQLGQMTAAAAETERLRRRPWLRAARWARGTFEGSDQTVHSEAEAKAAAWPTFLSASVAVLLVTGAASALSPIGSDLSGDMRSGRSGVQASSVAAAYAIAAAPPAFARETQATDGEPAPISYSDPTDTLSPIEHLASAFASASAVKGSRLEPTAVALTNTDDAAPRPLVTIAEYRDEPAPVESLYTAVLSGLPEGSHLSKGLRVGEGEWVLALDDLGDVEIAVPTRVKRVALARIEIAGQDGGILARFPLVVDPEGRIDTETVASVAVMKNGSKSSSRPTKVARLETPPPPVRVKPVPKPQKEAVAATAPQQKRKTAAVRPAGPIIKPTVTANIPIDTAEADGSASPVGVMPEGSAGLETFRTFSLLGADKPRP